MFRDFVETALAIAASTKKSVKQENLAAYLRSLDDPSLERAAVFFTGSPFPRREERVTGIGWSTIADAVADAIDIGRETLFQATSQTGDLGEAVERVFPLDRPHDLTLLQVGESFDLLAATRGAANKRGVLASLLRSLSASEAKFVVKILLGEFRIGLQEGLVESAIARAFDRPVEDVRRANMLTGDIGRTALLARSGALRSAEMTLFHPIGLMLAQAEEVPEEIIAQLGEKSFADDKYDGIRAQIHADGPRVTIYSRTLDDVTVRFPEVAEYAKTLGHRVLLDGEIVAFRERILPFADLQPRIGRRKLTETLLKSTPVVFFAFDILYLDAEVLLDTPLEARLIHLRNVLPADGAIRIGYQTVVSTAVEIEAAFVASRKRANEGLVVKGRETLYTPGRRGKSWLKFKKALATLDCVVTAAEYGHGKRRGVLSDYTFAVRRGTELLNIGKAYSGLTDAEIEELTAVFKSITTERHGPVHVVRPQVVLEVAFDRIQESSRHKSGYALRFPRIARIRRDKTVEDISTLDEVRRIYEGQLLREEQAQ